MRCENMSAFIVMDIVREAAKYPNAIHFEIGQPDLPPSPKVKQALQQAIEDNQFSYTESLGLPALREKFVNFTTALIKWRLRRIALFLPPAQVAHFLSPMP